MEAQGVAGKWLEVPSSRHPGLGIAAARGQSEIGTRIIADPVAQ